MIIQTDTDLQNLVGTWHLDTERTTVTVRTRMFGIPFGKATLRATGGFADVDSHGSMAGRFDIAAASITSRIGKRDRHLREADYLDVENHPTIGVAVTGGRLIGQDRVELAGTVDVRGRTSPLRMIADIDAEPRAVNLTASFVIDDSHLHIENLRFMRNSVTVVARFHHI